jgi:hypothetical protein
VRGVAQIEAFSAMPMAIRQRKRTRGDGECLLRSI